MFVVRKSYMVHKLHYILLPAIISADAHLR